MSINYAPELANKQEAFIKTEQPIIKVALMESFQASDNQVLGYRLKFLHGYTNSVLFTMDKFIETLGHEQNKIISFALSEMEASQIKENEYYRIQIAYLDKNNKPGIFSNMSVIKYTVLPQIIFQVDSINSVLSFGFEANDDTEKLLSVKFSIYNGEYKCLEQSETLYANYNNLPIEYCFGYYTHNLGEDIEGVYLTAHADYTTIDNYTGTSIINIPINAISPEIIQTEDKIKTNNDKGYVEFKNLKSNIYRSTDDFELNPIIRWDKLYSYNKDKTQDLFRDKNMVTKDLYNYLLQDETGFYQVNKITIDYEDAFLFDADLDFQIKYNPKVSSFKQIIQEGKIETMGSQYPFFFRNGNINYHEFPIGGLISYIPSREGMEDYEAYDEFINVVQKGDENYEEGVYRINIFSPEVGYSEHVNEGYHTIGYMNRDEYEPRHDNPITTNLTGDNIAEERKYKMLVLKWLNNGKPKVFKSPTEGNYIVKLSAVSLSPEDKLGRMLHNFQCTATEIAEYNIENLKKYNLI